MDTAPFLLFEAAAIILLGLGLVIKTARAQGGRWQALPIGLGGGALAFLALLVPIFLPAALAVVPNLLFAPDRRHPGGRLLLGAGAALAATPIVALAAFFQIGQGRGEDALLVAALIPLIPFLTWWGGWAVEHWRGNRGAPMVLVVAPLLSALALSNLYIYAALGLIAWLLWRAEHRTPKDAQPPSS